MSCVIAIRVTPRSTKPGIGGWRRDADGREELEVRVSAAPTDGEANAALIRLIAKMLGIPKGSIAIVGGQTSRHKRVAIDRPIEEVMALLPANPPRQKGRTVGRLTFAVPG